MQLTQIYKHKPNTLVQEDGTGNGEGGWVAPVVKTSPREECFGHKT